MVLQTLGKWSQIKGMSSPAAAGGDEEIALQAVKFLPYPVRLSSEAHLWAGPASWDLNKGGHSARSDKPLCCSRHVPPSPLLSPWTPSPPPTPPFLRRFFLLSASCILPPTGPPLHRCCCFLQNLIKARWRFHSAQLPLLSSVSQLQPRGHHLAGHKEANFSPQHRLFIFFLLKSSIHFV